MVEHYFRCTECGEEIVAPDSGEQKYCPRLREDNDACREGLMKKVYKPFAFVLKGGGFYGSGKV